MPLRMLDSKHQVLVWDERLERVELRVSKNLSVFHLQVGLRAELVDHVHLSRAHRLLVVLVAGQELLSVQFPVLAGILVARQLLENVLREGVEGRKEVAQSIWPVLFLETLLHLVKSHDVLLVRCDRLALKHEVEALLSRELSLSGNLRFFDLQLRETRPLWNRLDLGNRLRPSHAWRLGTLLFVLALNG